MHESTSTPAADSRMPPLDGLRGLATAMVIAYHAVMVTGVGAQSMPGRLLLRLAQAGWIGVDLFFALSGFLVTGILLRKRGQPGALSEFFKRRLLRIVPLYFVMLAVMLWCLPLLLPHGWPFRASLLVAREQQWALWSFSVNLWMAATGALIGGALEPCWSLCVEVHYYLIWPLLVWGLSRRRLAQVCVGALLAFPLLRGAWLLAGADGRAIYFATPTRLDAVVGGTLVALWLSSSDLVPHARDRRLRTGLIVGLMALACVFVLDGGVHERSALTVWVGYTAIALAACFAVAWASVVQSGWVRAALSRGPLAWLGEHSYALYLFNLPVFTGLAAQLDPNLPWRKACICLLGVVVSAGLAWVSRRIIEAPALALSRRTPHG